MKLLRVEEVLKELFYQEGNVEMLGVTSIDNKLNIVYKINGEIKTCIREE